MNEWPFVTLGEACEFVLDGTHGSPIRTNSGVPVLSAQNVINGDLNFKTDRYTSEKEYQDFRRRLDLRIGDVLLTIVGSIGRVAVVKELRPLVFQRSVAILRTKKKLLDSCYLYHTLSRAETEHQLKKMTNTSAQAGVYLSKLKSLEIPLPPLAEQKRIAAILDKAEAIRQKRQQAIKLADDFLRATFLDMFGDPVTNKKGWETKHVGEKLTFLTSGSRGWAEHYSKEGALFLRIQNVGNNELHLEDVTYVNPPANAEARRTKVQPGDVLLSITADLGRTAVIPNTLPHAYINQHLAILRFQGVDPLYASAFLSSSGGQEQIKRLNRGGVKAGLNFDDIRSLIIMLPPETLQKKWRIVYEKRALQALSFKHSLELSNLIFSSLTQRAFRGEL